MTWQKPSLVVTNSQRIINSASCLDNSPQPYGVFYCLSPHCFSFMTLCFRVFRVTRLPWHLAGCWGILATTSKNKVLVQSLGWWISSGCRATQLANNLGVLGGVSLASSQPQAGIGIHGSSTLSGTTWTATHCMDARKHKRRLVTVHPSVQNDVCCYESRQQEPVVVGLRALVVPEVSPRPRSGEQGNRPNFQGCSLPDERGPLTALGGRADLGQIQARWIC